MCAKDTPSKGVSYANVASIGKEELGEAIWIQFGREDLKINVEHLKHCLVGSWVDPAVEVPKLSSTKSWARIN